MLRADVMDTLCSAGWRKTSNFSQKEIVIQSLTYDAAVSKRQSCIDQFRDGLAGTGNCLDLLRKYPDMLKPFFVMDPNEKLNYQK